jgi:hypothetical protein
MASTTGRPWVTHRHLADIQVPISRGVCGRKVCDHNLQLSGLLGLHCWRHVHRPGTGAGLAVGVGGGGGRALHVPTNKAHFF